MPATRRIAAALLVSSLASPALAQPAGGYALARLLTGDGSVRPSPAGVLATLDPMTSEPVVVAFGSAVAGDGSVRPQMWVGPISSREFAPTAIDLADNVDAEVVDAIFGTSIVGRSPRFGPGDDPFLLTRVKLGDGSVLPAVVPFESLCPIKQGKVLTLDPGFELSFDPSSFVYPPDPIQPDDAPAFVGNVAGGRASVQPAIATFDPGVGFYRMLTLPDPANDGAGAYATAGVTMQDGQTILLGGAMSPNGAPPNPILWIGDGRAFNEPTALPLPPGAVGATPNADIAMPPGSNYFTCTATATYEDGSHGGFMWYFITDGTSFVGDTYPQVADFDSSHVLASVGGEVPIAVGYADDPAGEHRAAGWFGIRAGFAPKLLNDLLAAPGPVLTEARGVATVPLSDTSVIAVLGDGSVKSDDGQAYLLIPIPVCQADIDHNGVLNLDDINLFADAFIKGELIADVDGNGVLNLDDVNVFAQVFIAGCP
ncbi:MAG: GC-type dockerin domain-anchored protein [Phycisphaerales bacterium]